MKELLDELNKEISDINGQIQIKENEKILIKIICLR